MVNRIVKRDDLRQAEITIVMNDNSDVIGVEVALFQPISLVDFNFEKLFAPSQVVMNTRMAQSLWAAAGQPGTVPPNLQSK